MKRITIFLSLCLISSGYCNENEEETFLLENLSSHKKKLVDPFDFSEPRSVIKYELKHDNWPEVKVIDRTGGQIELFPIEKDIFPYLNIHSIFKVNYAGKRLKDVKGNDFRFISPVKLTFEPTEIGIKISEVDILVNEYLRLDLSKIPPTYYFITSDYKVTKHQKGVINVVDHYENYQRLRNPGKKQTHPNCI